MALKNVLYRPHGEDMSDVMSTDQSIKSAFDRFVSNLDKEFGNDILC